MCEQTTTFLSMAFLCCFLKEFVGDPQWHFDCHERKEGEEGRRIVLGLPGWEMMRKIVVWSIAAVYRQSVGNLSAICRRLVMFQFGVMVWPNPRPRARFATAARHRHLAVGGWRWRPRPLWRGAKAYANTT